ncbi:bis(5'-nucleosyl)-tetraphosphatase (symmetrical) [Vibrio sp. CAIM 722]|uniref:Bis(5'-nucleosyl)-tetraphosphatase, symmetrical n=1 Tax=Vibrio eleionomae TaxID=2653505 RepID=A0A7X4LIT6_9VIBR|nr:bis(5'-nucleosyl)-tetraphosphatase (symmetrical) ApaH [Vibrio eleionomae]MZI92702.1 bis(5'-nucleosyl)-tetraphosphatase (symmetrical) [Vibrio eleionomae]
MSTYIVGDIQGCLDELKLLLKQANFKAKKDELWLAGDLVARGPKSLETLRFVRSLGSSAKVILGNHDLHLLAVSLGIHKAKPKDKTQPILDAPDRDELLDWVRHQPLMLEHQDFVMCHAGISPQWDLVTARSAAQEVEEILHHGDWQWLLKEMYCNLPDQWSDELQGIDRYRYIINAFTRMRFCYTDARLDMQCKLPPKEVHNQELMPWFKVPNRVSFPKTIIFGHWAALEGYTGTDLYGLDTGCVWGGKLTMLRWEDKKLFTQKALENVS